MAYLNSFASYMTLHVWRSFYFCPKSLFYGLIWVWCSFYIMCNLISLYLSWTSIKSLSLNFLSRGIPCTCILQVRIWRLLDLSVHCTRKVKLDQPIQLTHDGIVYCRFSLCADFSNGYTRLGLRCRYNNISNIIN